VRGARQARQRGAKRITAQRSEQALPIRQRIGRDGALRKQGLINHQGCRLEGCHRLRVNLRLHAINGGPLEGDRDRHVFLIELTRSQ